MCSVGERTDSGRVEKIRQMYERQMSIISLTTKTPSALRGFGSFKGGKTKQQMSLFSFFALFLGSIGKFNPARAGIHVVSFSLVSFLSSRLYFSFLHFSRTKTALFCYCTAT